MSLVNRRVAKWGVSLWLAPFFVFAPVFVLAPSLVVAQAPVVVTDAVGNDSGRRAAPQQSQPSYTNQSGAVQSGSPAANGSLFSQVQELQNQVRELNGKLEEQERMLQQLKQEQQDNYNNLDKRLSGQSGTTPVVAASSTTASSAETPATAPATGAPTSEAEKQSYTDAYLLLKQNDLIKALAAFKEHVNKYPEGDYAGNSHYWMGEIHVLQNHPADARTEFSILIDKFPSHRKTPDATYKLGTLLFQMGDKPKAHEMLQKAAKGTGPTAALAKTFLKENF